MGSFSALEPNYDFRYANTTFHDPRVTEMNERTRSPEEHRLWLIEQIKKLAPWHHDIQLTSELSTGVVFSADGTLPPAENDGVSLISPDQRFVRRVNSLFPNGMKGARFLDCACNGGAYCFLSRQHGADFSVGFDVRPHWVDQARFVQEHRTVHPTDRIEFHVSDLYDLPNKNLEPFDLTYFSGLFYHLPDPISGLKIAAELTTDVLVLNTACSPPSDNPLGMTMSMESKELVMSGVHQLAWLPNGPEVLYHILLWLGFREVVLTVDTVGTASGRRVELIAARTTGRLTGLRGKKMDLAVATEIPNSSKT